MRTLPLLLATFLPAFAFGADIACDFSSPKLSPWMRVIGDAKVEGGVLKSAAQDNWQRSGLEVGPIPLGKAVWHIEYDFCPVVLGDQCQEFVSQEPSTHWYMCYLNPAGHMNLHTKAPDGWQLRASDGEWLQAGTWLHATVRLTATSIQYSLKAKDGKGMWDSGVIAMDDLGAETTFALVDEAAKTGGKTEWDNLQITTDDIALSRKLKALAAQLEERRREQERRAAAQAKVRAAGIALIPMPQEVELLPTGQPVRIEDDMRVSGGSKDANAAVYQVMQERLGVKDSPSSRRRAIILGPLPPDSPLRKHGPQAYSLRTDGGVIGIEAAAPEGFYYAAQTLCQLASQTRRVPAIRISDWPAIPNRLCMIAVSQGAFQVIDVDYWKRIIRELAAFKINYIMPYFEGGTMYYEKYPFLGLKGRDGFTIEKGKILSAYAKQHFIQIVPQQESLGHSGNLLCHDELKDLRESGDVFCSSNPKTFAFLGDLYDDLDLAFPDAKWIHVGGDEFAGGFAKCPQCAERAKQIGKPGLYAEHLNKLHEMLKARNRGMMIWWHEEGYTDLAAAKLPKDTVVFDWHYGNQASYPTLAKLQGEGFAQTWATPAVTRYYDAGNDWDNTFGNISGFMKAAEERKIPGECTCTWVHGVWGGRNLFELNLYGLVFSGACAWNPSASDYAGFMGDFGQEWYGLAGDGTAALIRNALHAPYGDRKEQRFWSSNQAAEEMLAAPLSATADAIKKTPALVDQAHELLGFCQRAYAALDVIDKTATRNQVSAEFYRHDVHIHEALARRIIATQSLIVAYERAKTLKGQAREDALTPEIGHLRGLVADYQKIEAMFDRSIKEAGGGKCGWGNWYPFVAAGGVQFRAPQGRAEIEKEIDYLNRALTRDDLPEKAFAG